jgi:hypothetical protein
MKSKGMMFGVVIHNHWVVECWEHYHEDGTRCRVPHNQCSRAHRSVLAWSDSFDNLVPTVMLNKYLDATLKTGLTSPEWFVGLVNNASFVEYNAADEMDDHTGWLEGTPYSNGTRPAFTPGTISAGSVGNSASKAVFNIDATLTIRGAFMSDDDTKGGTTGILGGEGDFSGGSKLVNSGDTVNVTVTCSLASA